MGEWTDARNCLLPYFNSHRSQFTLFQADPIAKNYTLSDLNWNYGDLIIILNLIQDDFEYLFMSNSRILVKSSLHHLIFNQDLDPSNKFDRPNFGPLNNHLARSPSCPCYGHCSDSSYGCWYAAIHRRRCNPGINENIDYNCKCWPWSHFRNFSETAFTHYCSIGSSYFGSFRTSLGFHSCHASPTAHIW